MSVEVAPTGVPQVPSAKTLAVASCLAAAAAAVILFTTVLPAEYGIDPLGTEPLADALAVRLAPGIRERQRHPRFLTALAVSLEVCSSFDEETLAADGVSAPWQVFEWLSLVKTPSSLISLAFS